MKENGLKMIISAALAGLSAYFGQLLIPFAVLLGAVIADYISGLVKAFMQEELSSKRGIKGIIKKLCYGGLVIVGMEADWLLSQGLETIGITIPFSGAIALIITIWLIINELISILENLYVIGVPQIPGLSALLKKLKVSAEVLEGKEEINDTDKKESGKFE